MEERGGAGVSAPQLLASSCPGALVRAKGADVPLSEDGVAL